MSLFNRSTRSSRAARTHLFRAGVTPTFACSATISTRGQFARNHDTLSSREPLSTTAMWRSECVWEASDGSSLSR